MFLQSTVVHFPEIPLLEIHEVRYGDAGDSNLLLMRITRGIWGRQWVIVPYYWWCYNLVPDEPGTDIPVLSPPPRYGRSFNDSMWWRSTTTGATLTLRTDGIWYIVSPLYGEGNWYKVQWGTDYAVAIPQGKWAESGTKPNVALHLDWPRWQPSRAYGNSMYDDYVGATTYVDARLEGHLRVGDAAWSLPSSFVGGPRVYRSPDTLEGGGHLFRVGEPGSSSKVGTGWFVPEGENMVWHGYTMDSKTFTATGPVPQPGQSWPIHVSVEGVGEYDITATWVGWTDGGFSGDALMFEVGRML